MPVYQYQQLTAPVGSVIPAPQLISEWAGAPPQSARTAPIRRNRSRINNLVTVPPPVISPATTLDQWQELTRRYRFPAAFANRATIVNAVTFALVHLLAEWEPQALRRVTIQVTPNRSQIIIPILAPAGGGVVIKPIFGAEMPAIFGGRIVR